MRISPSSTSRPAYANWAEYRAGVQKMFFEPNRSLKFTMKDDLRVHRRGALGSGPFPFVDDVVGQEEHNPHLVGRWGPRVVHRDGRRLVGQHRLFLAPLRASTPA